LPESGFKAHHFLARRMHRHEAHRHQERIKVMKRIKHTGVAVFAFTTRLAVWHGRLALIGTGSAQIPLLPVDDPLTSDKKAV
jgi:hypothetical protein